MYDMTAEEYHADPCPEPSLSSGIAHKLLSLSPLHAWTGHPKLNPNYKDTNDPKFDLGTIAHAMLLEDNDGGLVVVDAPDWRTKSAQQERAAAWAVGRPAILKDQKPMLDAMLVKARECIARSELAGILEDGLAERTIIWKDGDAWCRIRPDLWWEELPIILDYKTTSTTAEPEQVIRLRIPGYEMQAGFYQRGIKAVTGKQARFVFLFQEIEPPFSCSLIGMAPAWEALAADKAKAAINLWTHCLQSGKWPDYGSRILWPNPPAWKVAQWEASGDFNLDEILPK